MNGYDLFSNLDVQHSQLSKTIKRRTFYVEERGLKIRRRFRTLEEIVSKFTNEINEELNGFYRNHQTEYQDSRKYWQKQLMQEDYSYLLTIKLPRCTQSGFRRTRNREDAKKSYKKLFKEIQTLAIEQKNHWTRNALQCVGVMEHGKNDFWWHVHILFKSTDHDEYIGYRLCDAISKIVDKYKFYKTVFDLRCVYDKEGICAYLVKELKDNEDPHINEGSELFTMKTWFGKERFNPHKVNYFDIKQLKTVIIFALWLKQRGELLLPNPINKLRKILEKRLAHYVVYRRKGKIKPATNFDPFGRPFILFDTV